ncbi:MAG: hypothetical protein ABIN01_01240 [Ferruginibacter sp.]
MKKMRLMIVFIVLTNFLQAQSKQVKLYLQQIAANKVLIGHIRRGYKIAHAGLTTIGKIKNGDFNLHRDFFGSMMAINPNIKNYARVADILTLHSEILRTTRTTSQHLKGSRQFTDKETMYIHTVFERVLRDAMVSMDEMIRLLTPGQYKLTDDERISQIDALRTEMESIHEFVRRFSNDALILERYRSAEKNDVENSHILHGLIPNP